MIYFIKALFYKFSCWAFHRYTTVKPRHLNHEFHDISDLLPHLMFEALSLFVEKELLVNTMIDWDSDPGTAEVKKELLRLYDWYHKYYVSFIKGELYSEYPEPITYFVGNQYNLQFETEEDNKLYDDAATKNSNLDSYVQKELTENLHKLVDLTPYLWT